MPSYLDELYAHQEWADAEHWRVLQGNAAALADRAIRERVHHIHLGQSAFLWIVGTKTAQFSMTKAEDYPNMEDLKAFGRRIHSEWAEMLGAMDEARLAQTSACRGFSRRWRSACGTR
jgi:hypothetical protein